MAEELRTSICTGHWWNSARFGPSSCSNAFLTDIGGLGWPSELDMKGRSSVESLPVSISCNSFVYQDTRGQQGLTDSSLQITDFGFFPTIAELSQALDGRSECINSSIIQETLNPRTNFQQETQSESAGDKVTYQEDFPMSFEVGSAASFLLQDLFETEAPQPEHSSYEIQIMNHVMGSNDAQKQQPDTHLHFSSDACSNVFPSPQTQFPTPIIVENSNYSSLVLKRNRDEACDLSFMAMKNSEVIFKRPRIGTPSPLPTFKVRKEKLGDRVTALQQLVSPFGKTDTASVLLEAIEYIKFLHEQVNVLSTPYMKNGVIPQYQQTLDKTRSSEGRNQDLRSRGLCLMPISSTFEGYAQIKTSGSRSRYKGPVYKDISKASATTKVSNTHHSTFREQKAILEKNKEHEASADTCVPPSSMEQLSEVDRLENLAQKETDGFITGTKFTTRFTYAELLALAEGKKLRKGDPDITDIEQQFFEQLLNTKSPVTTPNNEPELDHNHEELTQAEMDIYKKIIESQSRGALEISEPVAIYDDPHDVLVQASQANGEKLRSLMGEKNRLLSAVENIIPIVKETRTSKLINGKDDRISNSNVESFGGKNITE
ncbi:hypothetical protein GIB67_016414 [Kingdonia uniflora]|uniref:BHLH domain-containing protein n=1 Tax=Kingdonia uniflora TaxID=39325 RepID=A0A7J7MH74_9MAGN|nr:hypothetical protein GIB67_016414 [Kingdonia uniflora]